MRIERSASPASSDASLIPMINVVFLLLIFFMVAGTIGAPDPLEATPPESARFADAPVAERTLHLASDGTLALNDESVTAESLPAALERLNTLDDVDASSPDIAAATVPDDDVETVDEASSGALLALRADAGTSFALLRGTVDALRAAGVERVELITVRAPAGGS